MSFSENNAIRKSYVSMLRKRSVDEGVKDGIRGITSTIKNIFKSTTRGTDSDIDKERHSAEDAASSENNAKKYATIEPNSQQNQQNTNSAKSEQQNQQHRQKTNYVNSTTIKQVSRAFLDKEFPTMRSKNNKIGRDDRNKLYDWGSDAFCLFGDSNEPLAVCAIKKNASGIDDVAVTLLASISENNDVVLLQKLIAQYSYSKFLWVVPSDATSDTARAYMNQRMNTLKVGSTIAFYKTFGSVPTFTKDVLKRMASII